MKKISSRMISPLLVFGFISFAIFLFYLFYVNFSIDTIILFLSSKIFLGKWLIRGIFPWYNPQIYLGVPFAFDVGLGNFHPFNLFFILPYPFSFALWSGFTSFLFMYGFYLFFQLFTKTKRYAFVVTLILFFSGSGFLRNNNPTIYLVIAHYGLYLYSLSFLKKHNGAFVFSTIAGILLTMSGHIQFVFYGYLLGALIALFVYGIKIQRVILHFFLVLLCTSWYYLLSLPLILGSTRMTTNHDYISTGNNHIMQYLQLILPYYLGYVQNGSKWNVGQLYTVLVSFFSTLTLIFLLVKRKIKPLFLVLLLLFFIASLGAINIPFFRGAGQATIFLHIFGLLIIAQNETEVVKFYTDKGKIIMLYISIFVVLFLILFFFSDLFKLFFLSVYRIAKHGPPGLFFDSATIKAVGQLFGLSFVSVLIFLGTLVLIKKTNKILPVLAIYVLLEGLMFNYFHGFYIPTSILTKKYTLPAQIDTKNYRIQTASDVVPYFGVATYMGDILFRPPFSKEKSIYTAEEANSYAYLKQLFSFIPSTWILTTDYATVQGFNTFIPKKLTDIFNKPSDDFRQEYGYIIQRNSLFGSTKDEVSINAIETSQITLNDTRWENLGVRYFISDRLMPNKKLIAKDTRYFYESPSSKPIYRVDDGFTFEKMPPEYADPNTMIFNIAEKDIGKKLFITMNPDGFEVRMNGKRTNIITQNFQLIIPLKSAGKLEVAYSPLIHMIQSLQQLKLR